MMDDETSHKEPVLIPIEERSVDFYGDEITMAVVQLEQHVQLYVPLRPICTYLGLSWSGQRERTARDPVLSQEVRFVRLRRTNLGGNPEVLCLPLEYLNGWLFGVNATRVKPELRDKVIRYQRECYRILWQAFQQEARPIVETPSVALAALQQIRNMGLAIAQMAEQQMEMEQRLTTRLDRAARVVGDLQRRLGAVETKLHPQTLVTDEQAEEISAAVKAVAELITTRDPRKNHYQGIFAELYRRFGVSSYKNIRLSQYEQVLRFLEDWRTTVSEGGQGPAER
jgi:P22_AR N-terminal domain/ORF6C domain